MLGRMPGTQELAAGGVRTLEGDHIAERRNEEEGRDRRAEGLVARERGPSSLPAQPPLCLGPGLPPIPARMAERIRENAYIDFSDLPPAKGKGKPVTYALEGQVIVVQAADLMQSQHIFPDLATWSQGVDHLTAICQTRKRAWNAPPSGGGAPSGAQLSREPSASGEQEVCLKYNCYQGDYRFGKNCRYLHTCSACRGPHPVAKCKSGEGAGAAGPPKKVARSE